MLNIEWLAPDWQVWTASGFCLALLAGLWLKEWKRPARKWLLPRLLASALLVLAVFLLAARPLLRQERPAGTAILLTSELPRPQLDSLKKAWPSAPVFTLRRSLARQATFVPGPGYLQRNFPETGTLVVAGNGLAPEVLADARSFHLEWALSPGPGGVEQVYFPRQLSEKDTLRVQGYYRPLPGQAVHLLLKGPGGLADSVTVRAPGGFTLKSARLQPGRFVYSLVARDTVGKLLAEHAIPVDVQPEQPLRVLMVSSAPGFEQNYLKNWLASRGYRVALRASISRDRYKTEFVNMARRDLSRLSGPLLEQFDVLVMDVSSLRSASPGERQSLEQQVKTGGLGILLQPDQPLPQTSTFKFFTGFPLKSTRQTEAAIAGEQQAHTLPRWPFALGEAFGLVPSRFSVEGEPLVAVRLRGQGRVGLSLLQDTWQLLLKGEPEIYARWWSRLLGDISKKSVAGEQWQAAPGLLMAHQAATLRLHTAQTVEGAVVVPPSGKQYALPLLQDMDLPFQWTGNFWPGETGWHQVLLNGADSGRYFFVHADTAWQAWQIARRLEANRQWQHAPGGSARATTTEATYQATEPLSWWWVLALLLLSGGGLWLEPKL